MWEGKVEKVEKKRDWKREISHRISIGLKSIINRRRRKYKNRIILIFVLKLKWKKLEYCFAFLVSWT